MDMDLNKISHMFDKTLEYYEITGEMSPESIYSVWPDQQKQIKKAIQNVQKRNKELEKAYINTYMRMIKTLKFLELTIAIIQEQPTEDDRWILHKLITLKNLLTGVDNENNTL